MADDPPLPPPPRRASYEEVVKTLSFGLRFNGRKPFAQASSLMARITAEHLLKHLDRCGFELVKRPDARAPSTSHHGHPKAPKPDER
jgi:hypothetical protein